MKANSGGQAPPEFLSTHPSNDTRIANLKAWAPKAKAEAKKFGVTTFRQKINDFINKNIDYFRRCS